MFIIEPYYENEPYYGWVTLDGRSGKLKFVDECKNPPKRVVFFTKVRAREMVKEMVSRMKREGDPCEVKFKIAPIFVVQEKR